MKQHPYVDLPPQAYWRDAVANVAPGDLDPAGEPRFRFGPNEKVVTAGSCFAQHIGRFLLRDGCNFLVTEAAHPFLTAAAAQALNYGVYSARYGNVYTARQLLQLFDRAFGAFTPQENAWAEQDGVVIDPFRPQIQPRGFNSFRELEIDRARHFAAVRDAFASLDVFIFTLGLTEAWRARADGAVFPLCPGVSGGVFDPARHEFVNFGVEEVVADMTAFLARLKEVNPGARVILTVSPVPLVATAEPRHVLVSTICSKAILRAACDMLERRHPHVAYFPSYEIVASGFAGDYYEADRRSVSREGVAHVMRVFERQFIARGGVGEAVRARRDDPAPAGEADVLAAFFKLICEEEALGLASGAPEDAPGAEGGTAPA